MGRFIIHSTAPLSKSVEIHDKDIEYGAFTKVLLEGLYGMGVANRYDEDADPPSYIVRMESLVKYIKERIVKQPGSMGHVPEYISRPGSNGEINPELIRTPIEKIKKQVLEIFVEPYNALPATEIKVKYYKRDSHAIHTAKGITTLPVPFTLLPKNYSVNVTAPTYKEAARVVSVYESKQETFQLAYSGEAIMSSICLDHSHYLLCGNTEKIS